MIKETKELIKWNVNHGLEWVSITHRFDTDTGIQAEVGIAYCGSMIGSGRDRAWCLNADEHAKEWREQQSNPATYVAPQLMLLEARNEKWAKPQAIVAKDESAEFLFHNIPVQDTIEYKQEIVHMHKGKLTKRQKEWKEEPRPQKEASSSNSVGRTAQPWSSPHIPRNWCSRKKGRS